MNVAIGTEAMTSHSASYTTRYREPVTLRFVHDQFRWDPATQRFLLIEPPNLFDEPPERVAVQAWRNTNGWKLVYTHQFTEADELGVVDLWSRADEPEPEQQP